MYILQFSALRTLPLGGRNGCLSFRIAMAAHVRAVLIEFGERHLAVAADQPQFGGVRSAMLVQFLLGEERARAHGARQPIGGVSPVMRAKRLQIGELLVAAMALVDWFGVVLRSDGEGNTVINMYN